MGQWRTKSVPCSYLTAALELSQFLCIALGLVTVIIIKAKSTHPLQFAIDKLLLLLKLCYRRRTARRDVSVKISLTAAQQCRNNLYDNSRTNRSDGVRGLQSTNKLVHSATTRSTVVGVIHKLTIDEFVDCANRSPKCTNHSRDHDHARLGDSQSSQC